MASSQNGKSIGVFGSDGFPGEFCDSWQKAMATFNFKTTDIEASIAYLMAIKYECELIAIKEACLVSLNVFDKYLKQHIVEIINSKKVSLAKHIIYR